MAMEYLSISIAQAINSNSWKPFRLRNHNTEVSHLLFVDDILLFAKANDESINCINSVIQNFCNISGYGSK